MPGSSSIRSLSHSTSQSTFGPIELLYTQTGPY